MSTGARQFAFGPLAVDFNGPESLLQELSKDFSPGAVSTDHDVVVNIVEALPELNQAAEGPVFSVGKGVMRFTESAVEYKSHKEFEWQVHNLFSSSRTVIFLKPKKFSFQRYVIRLLKQLLSAEFSTKNQFSRAQISTYSLLWFFLSFELMKRNAVFIHAGMLERDGGALAIVGTGGCGKTSLTLELLAERGFSYLSEDFGCVSENGGVSYVPKTISLYDSDLRFGNRLANAAAKKVDGIKWLKWQFLTKILRRNPILKVEPKHLSESIGNGAKLKRAFFLVRQDRTDLNVQPIDAIEFSARAFNASFRELSLFHEIENLILATSPTAKVWPAREAFQRRYREILEAALIDVSCCLVRVPVNAKPQQIATELLKYAEPT